MMKSTLVLPLLLLTVLGGCATQTAIPTDPIPLDLPQGFSVQGERQVGPQWWFELNDPALNQLVSRAFSGSFTLTAARERLIQAQTVARQAGADRQPILDGRARGGESWSRSDGSEARSGSLLLGLAASYEIDLWGRLQAKEDAAQLDAEARSDDLQTAALSLVAQIANTLYQLAAGNSQLELLSRQQEVNGMGLELIRIRFTAGQVGIADMLQQQQLIESKNGELARQRAACKVLEHQLAILTGQAPGLMILPAEPQLPNLPALPATGLPSELIQNRPDIRSSYRSLLAADRRVAVAIADRYPRLSIAGDLATSGSSTGDLFSDWAASLLANLTGPILDGGSRKAEVERVSAAAREKLAVYSDVILSAVAEVEDALVQEKEQESYIASLILQLELAQKTPANVRDRYKQGVENYQRVLSAQLSYQTLERSLLTAQRDRIGYRIDLYRALGGTAVFASDHTQPTSQR